MAFADQFWLYCIMNTWRTSGSGIVWIYSSVILQRSVPDKYRGRTFSFEYAAGTVGKKYHPIHNNFTFSICIR
jgi:hypothetical protein